ncbi:MAG: hypothetical protein ACT4PM_06685 [Gemmatimonadales bacterium]
MSRAPLRYLGWMMRDAAVRPGLAALVFAALFAFLATRLPGPLGPPMIEQLLVRMVGQFDWLIVLIATTGLVSTDRSTGFYRALFSHPINPAAYYLQRWILCGLGAVLVIPLSALAFQLVTGTFPWSGPLIVRFLLKYLLLGGLTFAFSTVIRGDWVFAFTISVVQSILRLLELSGAQLSGFTRTLAHVMPPFHVGSTGLTGSSPAALRSLSLSVVYPSGSELTHALLYGAGILALALAVLTFRPLGSGGRV